MISGLNPFNVVPNWTIDNVTLQVVPSIKYLGTILNRNQHIENRKQAAQKAFYSLQAAGLKYEGKIYKTAVQTVMSYGCSSVHLTQSNLKELDTLQGKHLKTIMGLSYSCSTSPLLEGLNMIPISTMVKFGALGLFKSCLQSNSLARHFYVQMLKRQYYVNLSKTLLGCVSAFLKNHNVKVCGYLLGSNHTLSVLKRVRCVTPQNENGLIDSVRTLICNYNDKNRYMLKQLLKHTNEHFI